MAKKSTEPKIDNFAIIQYQLKNGDMKILIFHDYDETRLKHRVSFHMPKKILSIQFYYNVRTNQTLHLIKNGVVVE